MSNKKYFSITEVSNIIDVPPHKLRYIEKSYPDIEISKIRGRRYYTKENMYMISQKLSNDDPLSQQKYKNKSNNQNILNQIDGLINKFSQLIVRK